jgi:hypothetical protein
VSETTARFTHLLNLVQVSKRAKWGGVRGVRRGDEVEG